jgi:hypothetical protein
LFCNYQGHQHSDFQRDSANLSFETMPSTFSLVFALFVLVNTVYAAAIPGQSIIKQNIAFKPVQESKSKCPNLLQRREWYVFPSPYRVSCAGADLIRQANAVQGGQSQLHQGGAMHAIQPSD